MRCDIVKERLSAYMDGELPHNEMQEISLHLEGCESCAKEFESLETLSDSLNNYFEMVSKRVSLDSIYDNVMEKIEKEKIKPVFKDENEGWMMRFIKSLLQYSPTFASIAAILIIAFALLPNQHDNSKSSKGESVSVESLEYSKFNAMIYKTKEQNKTVIWLFKQENDDDEFDDSI
ncbi:zf-HC2 domain-containing protein [bacterium]|nr:zf-HC2 domain-containing protein [bacterium]